MNIVFATSEVAPFAKTGGLADVCGALPVDLHLAGHNVAFAPTFEPLPAFFERFLNGFGERLAGFAGNLASQLFRGFILDEQGHVYSRIYLIDLLYTIRQAARMRTKSFPDRGF